MPREEPSSGARDGDLVRAVTSDRDANVVSGVLRLRHVPSLDYVQVHLQDEEGSWHRINPCSVTVVEAGVHVVPTRELDDPLVGEPGWRRVVDLDQAIAEGLVTPTHDRRGGSWDEFAGRLLGLAAPLLDDGWVITDEERQDGDEFGDSVHLVLNRDENTIEIELYEDDYLVLWNVDLDKYEREDWEPEEPLRTVDDATPASAISAFRDVGWLASTPT